MLSGDIVNHLNPRVKKGIISHFSLASFSGHPCEIANNECSDTCRRDGEAAICECPENWALSEDMKTCKKCKLSIINRYYFIILFNIFCDFLGHLIFFGTASCRL